MPSCALMSIIFPVSKSANSKKFVGTNILEISGLGRLLGHFFGYHLVMCNMKWHGLIEEWNTSNCSVYLEKVGPFQL